ncbi:MAG: type II toxin-antitoxin system VapC family toxin [Microbacteriaceae bacterium]|nr:type II toxin-antitoxin system VapC family toxin [Burkholderiaceae bacterium]
MKLLLDTHILLWLMQDAPQLSAAARRLIEQAESVHVSSVSLWEVVIKRSLGKLRLDPNALDDHLAASAVQPLAVSWAHARQLRTLPTHHGNPFDRMLVAQAMSEPLHLLTHDAALAPYSELVILV